MEIWLDTIDLKTIEKAKNIGLLDGITTNPTILAEGKKTPEDILEELLNSFSGPLAVQVTVRSEEGMIEQGKDLFDFSDRIIVKVPVTSEGLGAIYHLSLANIPVMATAIFEPMQAFLASQAGACYVVPYFSHIGENALEVCQTIQNMDLSSHLLIASLKKPEQFLQCASLKFDAVTLKGPLFDACLNPPQQTLDQIERFEASWQNASPSRLFTIPSS
jgi:TalC/MipB family fructose-6-phosphate aldolase